MLRNDRVADLLEECFNEVGKEYDEEFAMFDGAMDYSLVRGCKVVGVLTERGGTVRPIMNYVNTTCNYDLDIELSVQFGFGRIKTLNEIVNKVIERLNGVPLDLDGGRIILTFQQQNTSNYETRRPILGKSVIPKISFTVEYSKKQEGLRYEMALIDTPFDISSQDTRYFGSQAEQQEYYLNKINEQGVPFCELMTPNINSLLLQRQMYINDLRYYPEGTEKVKELNGILTKNYAIIRAMDGETAVSYYYYGVQGANVGANNQAVFDLKMDTVQTYYFNPDIEFGDCLITKAHLNRWVDNGDGTVSFDGSVDSKLFERENIHNVAKRLVNRKRLNPYWQYSSDISELLDEIIQGWIYVFVDSTHNFNLKTLVSSGQSSSIQTNFHACEYQVYDTPYDANFGKTSIPNQLAVLAVPIYKSPQKQIRFHIISSSTGKDYGIYNMDYNDAIPMLFSDNVDEESTGNSYQYMYQMKYSTIPPFDNLPPYIIDDNGIIFTFDTVYSGEAVASSSVASNLSLYSSAAGAVYINLTYQPSSHRLQAFLENIFTFNKTDIINSNKDPKFNPKLLGEDYRSLSLSNELAERFDYDIQKLNQESLPIYLYESITPDINKQYLAIEPNGKGVYSVSLKEMLFGLVSSNDNSLGFISSSYQDMLAHQKNYFIQNDVNRKMGLAGSMVSNVTNALSGNVVGAATGQFGALMNFAQNSINQDLTIDNIKNAPNNVVAAKGNIFFENMYTRSGYYLEEWDILPHEKNIVNDYMCLYGFTINLVDNIKNYDNIRKYYNFIRASIDNINGISISDNIRNDMRQRFAEGLRFWNMDNISYKKENYEKWLED